MKRTWNKGFALLCGMALSVCVSCGDTDLFDTDKWSDKIEGDWEPAFKAPLAYGEFTLWDLLQNTTEGDESPIQKVPVAEGSTDSMLVVKYTEEDIYEVELDDIFKLESSPIVFRDTWDIAGLVDGYVPGIEVPIPKPISFEKTLKQQIGLPDDFVNSELSEIKLNYKLSYQFPKLDDVHYRVAVYLGGEEFFGVEVNGDEIIKYPAELETKTFTLAGNAIELTCKVDLLSGTYRGSDLNVRVNFSDFDFEYVRGKIIKSTPIIVEGDPFKIDNEFLDDIEGSAKFLDPQLFVTLKNKGIGVDADIDLTLSQQKKEEATILKLEDLKFVGNSTLTLDTISQKIDKNLNPEILEFFSLPLKGDIEYSGAVYLNPDREECVIYKEGSLSMDVEVVIPLRMEGDLTYKADLSDVDIDLDEDYTDKIDTATLTIQVKNDLPLALSIPSLILMNKGAEIARIKVASTDGDGVKAKSSGTLIFPLSQEVIREKLNRTDNIQLEIRIANDDKEGDAVLSTDKVKFTLSADLKAHIEDLEL